MIIIVGEFRQNLLQMLFVDHDQMIGALTPDRPDQAFNTSVLPGCAERGGPIPDAHRSDAGLKYAAECLVIIANEICGSQRDCRPTGPSSERCSAFAENKSPVL